MKEHRKLIIAIVVILFAAFSVFLYNTSRKRSKRTYFNNGQLYIENYIFTKLTLGKGLIRIYGINKSDNDIDHFPVIIKYYTKSGKYLGKDESDLLTSTKAVLKAGGKLNAQVNVFYPKDADKVEIGIKQN